MKIASIIGARPNFVKCAPLSRELKKEFDEVIIWSTPGSITTTKWTRSSLMWWIENTKTNLGVGSGSHGSQTGEIWKRTEEALIKTKGALKEWAKNVYWMYAILI